MLFTSQFNKLLWSLKRKLNISHKRAYHLARNAMRFGYDNRLQADSSVFGTWSNGAALCAGHYCQSLSTAYEAAGDKGRSIAFYRAASIIQNMNNTGAVNFGTLLEQKYIGSSIELELVDMYLAAHVGGHTPRAAALIEEFNVNVTAAAWSY